jgi:hypothetical protein
MSLSPCELSQDELSQNELSELQEKMGLLNMKITDYVLWSKISKIDDINKYTDKIKFLLLKYGTKEPCNRFDVGNTIEFIIADLIRETNLLVSEKPNAKRIDISIENSYDLSIKYSSCGDITLHNSNGAINKDNTMTDFLLLTTKKLFLITKECLKQKNINLDIYLKNTGDSLKLKRKILRVMEKEQYPYIEIDKNKCENALCSKLFYKMFQVEYENEKKLILK